VYESLLPVVPASIICTPIISNAIDINIPATTAPRYGDAKINTDTPTPKMPAL